MKQFLFVLITMLVFGGCSSTQPSISDVDKKLKEKDAVYIYDIKMDNILKPSSNEATLFEKFPFNLSALSNDFKGRYAPTFYEKNNVTFKSSRMDRVDYWSLEKNLKSIDIIYTKAIWINHYKKVSNDVFTNICYAHKLSKEEQAILKKWIKEGGTLWIENGLYVTNKEFNSASVIDNNSTFLSSKIKQYNFESFNFSKNVAYENLRSNAIFQGIQSLQVNLKRNAQIHFLIQGDSILLNNEESLINVTNYEDGKIISLLPFEFTSLYRDGELLRWGILNLLESGDIQNYVIQPALKVEIVEETVAQPIPTQPIPTPQTSTTGSCIQLFSCYDYDKAQKDIVDAKTFPLARIEKRGKAYTGRVGIYQRQKEAFKDLERLKEIYPNAFIRRCTYETPIK